MSERNCAIGKDYAPASFKGVPFYCREADVEGGRRGAEGEFPFGEETAYADLGRKIRVYHLVAAFRRDDHVSDSQALFNACESPGPGMLVHPTRGTVMVACRQVKVRDQIEDAAGETQVDLEFVEANTLGLGGGLFGGLFGIISSGLNAISSSSFQEGYRPAAVSQPWRKDVVNTAQMLVGAVARVAVRTLTEESPASEWRKVLAIEEVAKDEALATSAVNVDKALQDGFSAIAINEPDPEVKFTTFRKLANIATSSSRLPAGVAVESEEAVLSRHRILAAIGMAEAAMGRKYPHLHAALAAMDQVLAVLRDEELAAYNECDNGLFLEIRKYSTEFAAMMNDLAYRLPGIVRVDFAGGVHPLVAAYTIYRDAKRHRELEERNIVDANGRFDPLVVGISPQ